MCVYQDTVERKLWYLSNLSQIKSAMVCSHRSKTAAPPPLNVYDIAEIFLAVPATARNRLTIAALSSGYWVSRLVSLKLQKAQHCHDDYNPHCMT